VRIFARQKSAKAPGTKSAIPFFCPVLAPRLSGSLFRLKTRPRNCQGQFRGYNLFENFLTAQARETRKAPGRGSQLVIKTCTPLRFMLGDKPRNFAPAKLRPPGFRRAVMAHSKIRRQYPLYKKVPGTFFCFTK
jgi:hypothetical protein